jgi:hypothetical protein
VQSHQIETTNAPASMPTNAPASIPTNVAASIPTNVAASLPTNDHTEALHFFQSIQCPCQAMLETAHSIWRQRERTLELGVVCGLHCILTRTIYSVRVRMLTINSPHTVTQPCTHAMMSRRPSNQLIDPL